MSQDAALGSLVDELLTCIATFLPDAASLVAFESVSTRFASVPHEAAWRRSTWNRSALLVPQLLVSAALRSPRERLSPSSRHVGHAVRPVPTPLDRAPSHQQDPVLTLTSPSHWVSSHRLGCSS